MRSLEGYILPAAVTVLLHAALLVMLTANWQPQEPLVKPAPRHVKAKLVSLDKKSGARQPRQAVSKPPQPKPEPPKPKPEPPKPEPPKPKPEPPKPEPPKPEPKPQPKPQAKPKPEPKAEPPKPDPKVQEEARKREQARREAEQKEKQKQQREQRLREEKLREQELAAALASEDEALAEEGDAETTTYEEAIAMAIEDNWSRPPSARRDMQVVLRIQLIPTGEVVGVSVIKSSGDEAFDRSAINAVNKAGRFPEVADAPPQVFERHLRSLQLVFRPEDLRL
jgi:colicin import membrane protein